jgi:hypothetical protein
VEDDAFEEVAEGEVMVLGEGFQHLQDTFLHPDAGLDSLDLEFVIFDGCSFHMYLCTRVLWYCQWGSYIQAHDEQCAVVATGSCRSCALLPAGDW